MDRGAWWATYSPGLPRVRQDGATNTQVLKTCVLKTCKKDLHRFLISIINPGE